MELKSPTPKRKGRHIPKSSPFPIFSDSSPYLDEYTTFSGYFTGNSVIVDDPEEMKALYSMGFFGKASLSKSFPNFGKHKKKEPIVLKKSQWERRKEWSNKLQNLITAMQVDKNKDEFESNISTVDSKNNFSNITESQKTLVKVDSLKNAETSPLNNKELSDDENNQEMFIKEINLSISETKTLSICEENKNVLVINDCNDVDNLSNLNPHIETEIFKTVVEVLYLTLEESFFLSFALGCLRVMDLSGKTFTLLQLWQNFNHSQPDFIENYVAYHYFRAKGWVVKSGLKFGGNFILYKDGPPFYHASYIVILENIKSSDNENIKNKEGSLTWEKVNYMNRMAESCNKEIIVCKIQWPEMTKEEKENPLILKKFKVKEFLIRRWRYLEKEMND